MWRTPGSGRECSAVLLQVFALLGTPSDATWPGAKDLPAYLQFTETKPQQLEQAFKVHGKDLLWRRLGLHACRTAQHDGLYPCMLYSRPRQHGSKPVPCKRACQLAHCFPHATFVSGQRRLPGPAVPNAQLGPLAPHQRRRGPGAPILQVLSRDGA
jgi:hypothetical protein